jgi:large subunit ribosomal protein L17
MRHLNKKVTLGRVKAQRDALMRSLCESLVLNEKIRTTRAKARALRTVIEPLVTKAKKNTLASRRLIIKNLFTEKAVKKMMEIIGPRYAERAGGYTRLVKLSRRPTDAAEMVRIEFV